MPVAVHVVAGEPDVDTPHIPCSRNISVAKAISDETDVLDQLESMRFQNAHLQREHIRDTGIVRRWCQYILDSDRIDGVIIPCGRVVGPDNGVFRIVRARCVRPIQCRINSLNLGRR